MTRILNSMQFSHALQETIINLHISIVLYSLLQLTQSADLLSLSIVFAHDLKIVDLAKRNKSNDFDYWLLHEMMSKS